MRKLFWGSSAAAWALSVMAGANAVSAQDVLPERPRVRIELIQDVDGRVKQVATEVEAKAEAKANAETAEKPAQLGEYWLGVQLGELSDGLRAQLGIESGVMVVYVMPDSPAQKVEVKPYDVILDVSGKAMREPKDLVGVVNESKDKELELTLIRSAKKMTLKITPAKRPPEQAAAVAAATDDATEDALKWLHGLFQMMPQGPGQAGQPPIVLWQAQPPAMLQAESLALLVNPVKLPKNVSVQIMKTGEEPTRVVVKRDDKTYEGTEGKLDEIPSDLRPQVEQMLGGRNWRMLAAPHVRMLRQPPAVWEAVPGGVPPAAVPARPTPPTERRPQIRARVEERTQEGRAGGSKAEQDVTKKLEAVLERLEKLQADVDALKK